MAEQPTDPAAPQPQQPDQPSDAGKPRRRKKRTWLKVLAIVLLLLILLIVFLPSIASTGPVKSYVVGKINENLNGTVQINDWSIGWTSGIDIDGVKLLDQQGVTVLTISRVRVPISLLNAAKGNYALGDVLIERPDLVKFVIYEDGTTNYGQIVKSDPHEKKPDDDAPTEIPDLSGTVTIKDLKGSIYHGEGPAVMVIQPSDIVVGIPDINGPISNEVRLAFGPNGAQPGTLTLAGAVDAIENNQVAVNQLSADQKLGLASVDLAALAPLLKMAGVDATLAGVANGTLALKGAPASDVAANGEIQVANFKFGGPMLKDTFETSVLRLPVQVTSTSQGGVTRLTARDTGLYFDQGSVVVTADAPLDALQNAAAQKPPGGDGTARVEVKIPKLADLANQMPNTLKLAQGVKLTEGSASEVLNVTLTKEAATITSALDLTGVRGTKDGQPLRPLDPVHLTAAATSFGGQDLRNLALKLTSGFATAEGGGASLANLNLTSNIDLRKLREQAGQFTDALDPLESGSAMLTLTTKGDPTKENALIDTNLNLELKDLYVVEPATQPSQQPTAMLREPWMRLGGTGGVQRGTTNFIEGVKNLVLTIQTNNPQKPTVDVEALADVVMKTQGDATVVTAPTFRLTKFNVDLPAARDEFRAFLDVLDEQGLEPTAGRVSLGNPLAGSYDGNSLVISADAPLALVAANVTMRKTDPATKAQTTPIENRTMRVNVAGAFDLGETFAAKLSQFAVVEDRNLFNVAKDGSDLVVRMPSGRAPQGSGTLVITADLVGMNQVLAAFGSPLIEKKPDGSMDLQAGQLGARIKLASNGAETNVNGAVDINGLTLTTAADPIRDESVQTVVKLTLPVDDRPLTGSMNIVSSFAKAAVENVQVRLHQEVAGGARVTPPVWEMIRRLDVTADVEDLSKTYGLYNALTPTTKPAGTAAAVGKAAEPEPPLTVQSGSASMKLTVTRERAQTNVNLSEARIKNLAFSKGAGSFESPRDIAVTLSASIDATDRIRKVTVPKLASDLGVAMATLTTPLVVSLDADKPSVAGALQVDGQIEDISRLLEALGGEAPGAGYPYAGRLVLTQRVTSAGGPIQLTGKATATDFVVYQQGTQSPAFTEKQLDLTQNITLDTTAKRAVIKMFALDMPTSGALKLNATGGVTDWATTRKIDPNTRVDVTYDLAKLWPIIKPLISEEPDDYKDLVIAGQAQRTFVFGGSYPATDASGKELPFHEAIKSLTASGGLTVQKFSYEGFDLADLDLPLYLLPNGQLVTVYADRPREKRHPTPAKLNGGTIDLGGFTIDLGQKPPRLSIPKKQGLLANVSLNPVFADNVLGKFLNPSFVDPEQARGLIDVTVGEVTNVPLGDLITGRNESRAHLIMSIREVQIGNAFLNNLLGKLNVDTRDGALLSNIRDAQITIENGILTEDLDFQLENFTLAFDGKVRLKDQALLPLVMSVPTARLRALSDDLRKYVPESITVPITGTTTAPKWNLDVVVQNLVVEAGKKALLGGALERATGRTPGTTTQPSKQEDPVGGLLEGILNRAREQKQEKEPAPSEKEPSGSDRISQPKE